MDDRYLGHSSGNLQRYGCNAVDAKLASTTYPIKDTVYEHNARLPSQFKKIVTSRLSLLIFLCTFFCSSLVCKASVAWTADFVSWGCEASDSKKFLSCIFGRKGSAGHDFATFRSWFESLDVDIVKCNFLGFPDSRARTCVVKSHDVWRSLPHRA